MPFSPINVVNGSTAANATWGNNAQTQYTEASLSFNPDLFAPFVKSGLVTSRHNSYSSNVLALNPLRYYRLDDAAGSSAIDSSTNGQYGTYVASPTLGAASLLTGDPDAAVTFNGTSQYATVPTTGLPTGAGAWSIAALVKPTNATNTGDRYIASFGDGGVAGRAGGIYQVAAGGWGIGIWSAPVTSGGTSAAGITHHVVGTFDGTNMRLYVDGSLVAGPTAAGTAAVSGTHAAVGALWSGSAWGSFFPGTVDEVAFYNAALTGTQVSTLYAAGTTATTQVDVTAGIVYPKQSDNTTRQRSINSASYTTVTINTTYYLYAQPDGTTYWNTANTPAANSLAIAQVTTDGSGNVSLVTDMRTLTTTLLPSASNAVPLSMPVIVVQSLMQHVTSTAQASIIFYTAPATGLYRAQMVIRLNNGTSGQKPAAQLSSWTDFDGSTPPSGNAAFIACVNSAVVVLNGSEVALANGSIICLPLTFWAQSGSLISITYTDNSGTPNDYVTCVLERLA